MWQIYDIAFVCNGNWKYWFDPFNSYFTGAAAKYCCTFYYFRFEFINQIWIITPDFIVINSLTKSQLFVHTQALEKVNCVFKSSSDKCGSEQDAEGVQQRWGARKIRTVNHKSISEIFTNEK